MFLNLTKKTNDKHLLLYIKQSINKPSTQPNQLLKIEEIKFYTYIYIMYNCMTVSMDKFKYSYRVV